MNTKPLTCYLKITLINPEKRPGKDLLRSAVAQAALPGESPVEVWKPFPTHCAPPLGAEIELGPTSGYAKIENIYMRERDKTVLTCIALEDDYRNNLPTLLQEGWKIWKQGSTEALAKNL